MVSSSKYQSAAVYMLYAVRIQTSVSILRDQQRSGTDGACAVCLIVRCATLRMAYGAETCSSLIFVINFVLLTAFVGGCSDCKDCLVIRSFDFLSTRLYTVGRR
jgi:hypothetical protein